MNLGQLFIRGAVVLGLIIVFVVMVSNATDSEDADRTASVSSRPTPTAPPTPTMSPRPTLGPTPLPPQEQLCAKSDETLDFADAILHDHRGQIIGLVYCDGPDIRYVTYVDMDGRLERTYLYEEGVLRVRLYHAGGRAVKREDFDAEGNLVPQGTYVKLPSSSIGPRRPTPTVTPSPQLLYAPTPLPPQDQMCDGSDPAPPLTEIDILSSRGDVFARVYCDGPDIKYVTYVDMYGLVERTYLYEEGTVRVKLYYSNGAVIKREDFDAEGNLVPDGTYIKLPSILIGPGRG